MESLYVVHAEILIGFLLENTHTINRRQHTNVQKMRGRKNVVTTVKINIMIVCHPCGTTMLWDCRTALPLASPVVVTLISHFRNPISCRVVSALIMSLDIRAYNLSSHIHPFYKILDFANERFPLPNYFVNSV